MAISVRDVDFAYDRKEPVLRRINLEIASGRFTAILGRNGSGKSTLLKVMAGLLEPDRGSVNLSGKDLGRFSLRERAKRVGFLPQAHAPAFPFSVADVILTGRASHVSFLPSPEDLRKAEAAAERVGIRPLWERPYTHLSGGERQLVMIARVLAQEPKILLLDEPLSGLDLPNQTRILRMIHRLVAAEVTVVAVLHDPNAALQHADEIILMKNGEVLATGPARSEIDPVRLSDTYGIPLERVSWGNRFLVIPVPWKEPG